MAAPRCRGRNRKGFEKQAVKWLSTDFGQAQLAGTVGSAEALGHIECTDGDIVPIKIMERKLHCACIGIQMWLFLQPANERARHWQGYVKVVDPEEQEEAVARLGVVGLVNVGCSWAPHLWRQSKTVPSESRICPKSSWAGVVSGRPSSD